MSTAGSRTPRPRVTASTVVTSACTISAAAKTLRRSNRSASNPPTGEAMLCGANVARATNPVWTAEPGVRRDEAADDDQLDPGSDVADDGRAPQKPNRSVAKRQERVVGHNKTPG